MPVMYIVRRQSNSCRSTEKSREWRYSPWEITTNRLNIAKAALEHAAKNDNNVVILDTAGRLHVDEEMMAELQEIKETVEVHQTILVVDAMTGQDAVNVARHFR